MTPADYCADRAAPPGSSHYYACLFYPLPQRQLLYGLFALHSELSDSILECQEPAVALVKMQWWQEEIAALYQGRPRHPVSRRLAELEIPQYTDESELQAQLVGHAARFASHASPDLEHMLREKEEGEARLWSLAGRLLGQTPTQAGAGLARLGAHYYTLDCLLEAPRQLHKGYCPFPDAELEELGLDAQALLTSDDARDLAAIQVLLVERLRPGLLQHLESLSTGSADECLFAIVLARIAGLQCAKLLKSRQLLPHEVPGITPLRKLWIAWQVQRQLR